MTDSSFCSVCKSCLTLHESLDCGPPGSSVCEAFQARILDGLPFPSPEDLPDPGIKALSSALAGGFFATEPPGMHSR